MCILFLHVNPNPEEGEYRLIVAANRDEFYKRPSKDAFKCDENIIGGRDMENGRQGGMWLGFTTKRSENHKKTHCFAALLNLTGELKQNAEGRGKIVKEYLKCERNYENYVNKLRGKAHSGFNFVTVEFSDDDVYTRVYSNTPRSESLFVGKHTIGVGNSLVASPLNKVLKGKEYFEDILSKKLPKEMLIEELLTLLKNPTRHLPDKELEKRAPTHFEYLSSIFVRFEQAEYGTRAHSIVLIDSEWNFEFIEHAIKQPITLDNHQWNINTIRSRL